MKNELIRYKKYVQRKLKALLPVFANSSTGNFKRNVSIPADEDDFTELYVGIQLMLDVIREKIKLLEKSNTDLEKIVRQKTKALEEAQKISNIGSWEWDIHTDHISWSRELYKIYDIHPKLFKTSFQEYLKLIHPDDQSHVNSAIQKALHHKKVFRFVHRLITAKGEMKVLSCKGKTLKNEEGEVIKMIGTVQDITQQKKVEENLEKRVKERTSQINKVNNILLEEIENRKQVEEELLYEKEKIQNYLNIAKIIFVVIDRNQKISMINKKGFEMLGYSEKEMVGEHWYKFTASNDKNVAIKNAFKDLITGNAKAIEYYENLVRTHEGKFLLIAWHITLIKDKNNNITGVLCAGEDITESSKTVEQLKESEEKYRTLVETMNEGVMTVDGNDVIQFVNKKYCEMTGYSQEELIGKKAKELLLDKSFYGKMDDIMEMRENGNSSQYEIPIVNKEGNTIWMLISGTPLYNREGKIVGSIGIHTDINERKKNEQELIKAKEIAEESSKSKEAFFTNMSHEIRTPMNGIVGLSDLLTKTPLNDKQTEYLGAIKKSSKNLLVIINDLLDFSKIEAGKIEIVKSPFDIYEVVNDAVNLLKVKAEQKGLIMKTEIAENVPHVLMGDPVRINQILTNLLSNSVKFTLKGEVKTIVQLKSETDAQTEITFQVSDTGMGIPEKMHDKIFDVFVQAHSSKLGTFGGTGLGLAIVKKLVTIMNGNIFFNSKENEGTTFTFSLPFEKGTGNIELPEKEELIPEVPLNLSVLVAEDNAINQLLVSEILSEWKCSVDIVETGVLAIEKVKQKNYDVILMDIQMPELNGVDATKTIRAMENIEKRTVPIIALTAHATQQEKTNSFSAGVNEYITKPFNPARLYSKIAALTKDRKKNEKDQ